MYNEADLNKTCMLLLGLPDKAFCGIDLLSFTTNEKFKGIKNIPAGWHFVFTGATDSYSLRHGVWIYIEENRSAVPQIYVRRWDVETEQLVAEVDDTQMLRYRANLGEIWHNHLTPYRQSAGDGESREETWHLMTESISSKLMTRVLGHDFSLTSASSAKEDVDRIPGLDEQDLERFREKDLNFLPINLKQTWREGAVGRERTDAAKDRSWALEDLIAKHCDNDACQVLGELQLAFVMILTLNNNSCLEQWKRLLGLLLTCKSTVVPHRVDLYVQALALLKTQLKHCQEVEDELFDLSDESGNLLKVLLGKFRSALEEVSGDGKGDVMDELDAVEDYLRAEYGWSLNEKQYKSGLVQLSDGDMVDLDMNGADEEDETGDYAPTVVELTPEQAEHVAQNGAAHGRLSTRPKPKTAKEIVNDSSTDDDSNDDEDEDIEDLADMDARY